MATVVHDRPQYERRTHERRRNWTGPVVRTEGMKVSWGGIWGGVLVAIGALMLLTALGVAIGVSAVNPGQTDPGTVGAGAGIWAGISLLIALFLGGMVATRIGAITDRTTGFFEGVLVWVVSLLIMAYLASSGIGMLASGAFQMLGGATQAIGTAVQGQTGQGGVNLQGTVDEVAQRLRDPQTAQQVAQISGLPLNEVRSTLDQTAQRVEANRDNPSQALQEAQRGVASLMDRARQTGALEQRAEEIQPEASAAAWMTLGALVLSLLAAVVGAMVGRSRVVAAAAQQPATTS